jgi:hypothetical protein
LGHVDATLRLLDPSVNAKEIPNKRYPKRVRLFSQGELGRSSGGYGTATASQVTTAAVVTAILKAGGHVKLRAQHQHRACGAILPTLSGAIWSRSWATAQALAGS